MIFSTSRYSISPADGPRFESLAAHHFANAASECSEFLRHKRYLISPAILKKSGIKYKTQVQRPGDAIITFPGSYHFGFNTGFNVAESSNFAIPEWIPQGIHSNICLCRPDSVRIDMDRITALLIHYEQYCLDHQHRISYRDWATLELERKAKQQQSPSGKTRETYTLDTAKCSVPTRSKSKIVPISYPSRKKQQQPQRKAGKWNNTSHPHRIAQKASPKHFKKKSKVLYFQQDESLRCLEGTIIEVIENHARVNFKGLSKKDDEWIRLDSADLFLDGGAVQNVSKNTPEKKKRKKRSYKEQSPKMSMEKVNESREVDLFVPNRIGDFFAGA